MLKILIIVGARPNFMKAAPIFAQLRRRPDDFDVKVVHTGQHYDAAMSDSFFKDLGLPEPDFHLGVGSASHAEQTAKIMLAFEPVVIAERPDWVVVVGDVNSTVACALVASKLGVRIAHVEAGLRSFDRSMPEEINRIVTDRLADLLLTPSRDAVETLKREGEPDEEIAFVGNVMIDTLFFALEAARETRFRESLGLARGEAVAVTLHRPSNVDDPARLAAIVAALREIAEEMPVVFPVHPRTMDRLRTAGETLGKVRVMEPVRYVEMLDLVADARAVVTDSGGLQEETTALGVPCLTVRENTERPITISEGTNRLVPDPSRIAQAVRDSRIVDHPRRPDGWDGCAGGRIVQALIARHQP